MPDVLDPTARLDGDEKPVQTAIPRNSRSGRIDDFLFGELEAGILDEGAQAHIQAVLNGEMGRDQQ